MDIDKIKNRIKNKSNNNNLYFKKLLIRLMILSIMFLSVLILIKNNTYKEWINKNILSKNFSFASIKSFYTKYFGNVLPFDTYLNDTQVFNEKLVYKDINKYKDGISLTVENNYLVPIQYSGIVTFIGEKEDYGKTIVIESDNITIWYSNIDNYSVKLYDNVEAGKYLGETIDNKLYLVFKKDGEIVDYKEYI